MSSAVNLRSFRSRVRHRRSGFTKFLNQLIKKPPRGLDNLVAQAETQVWREVDCLSCGNCCREMSPTYTNKDIRRIAYHSRLSPAEFKKKWLRRDKNGDWLNKSTPCQFFDVETNRCGIYAIRPADCAGFPHLTKKKMVEYMHVHKQNINVCPATFKMVEKMMLLLRNRE